jgi:hypothetical protein
LFAKSFIFYKIILKSLFTKSTKIDKIHKMAEQLPIPPSLKVTPKTIYVGDPKQLLDLLASQVATPILEITRTKGNMPLYKLKLRCKTLFPGNLDLYFLLDYPNQALSAQIMADGKSEIVLQMGTEDQTWPCVDQARASKYAYHLDAALNFWAVLMEQEVQKVYPDKTPVQVDRYAKESLISMKPNVFGAKTFELSEFLQLCDVRHGNPCFKVSYGWVASKEDPRSESHMWGFKFELSPFPQYPYVPRVRKALSAAEKSIEISKKRKVELEEEALDAAVAAVVEPSI